MTENRRLIVDNIKYRHHEMRIHDLERDVIEIKARLKVVDKIYYLGWASFAATASILIELLLGRLHVIG